jgi:hypothetical protein
MRKNWTIADFGGLGVSLAPRVPGVLRATITDAECEAADKAGKAKRRMIKIGGSSVAKCCFDFEGVIGSFQTTYTVHRADGTSVDFENGVCYKLAG